MIAHFIQVVGKPGLGCVFHFEDRRHAIPANCQRGFFAFLAWFVNNYGYIAGNDDRRNLGCVWLNATLQDVLQHLPSYNRRAFPFQGTEKSGATSSPSSWRSSQMTHA